MAVYFGPNVRLTDFRFGARKTSFQSITTIFLKNTRDENVGLSQHVKFQMWINSTRISSGEYNGQAQSGGFSSPEFLQDIIKRLHIDITGIDGKPLEYVTCSCQSDDPGRVFATQETRIGNVTSFVNLPKPGVGHQLPDVTLKGVGLGTRFSWRVNLTTGVISKV